MRSRLLCVPLCAVAAALLLACGGGGDGDQSTQASYSKMVVFGDSLSDVGSYKVSTVASVGGGRYTVNSGGGENWTELLAAQLKVSAPCAAQTGLNSVISSIPAVAVSNHAGCYSYAQGGARVTDPVGPGNLALGTQGALGQLTVPIVTQIANHLATTSAGTFAASDLVVVMAGGNDGIINLAQFAATVGAGGDASTAATAAVTAMATAASQLAGYVNTQIVAKGAQRVVLVNLPDLANTPLGVSAGTAAQAVIANMVSTFNSRLAADVAASGSKVLLVDAYTVNHDQITNPAQYALTNVSTPACDLTNASGRSTTPALLLAGVPTSLLCSTATTISGDVSHYLFADTVHPTPFGYRLLAQLVTDRMVKAGWL